MRFVGLFFATKTEVSFSPASASLYSAMATDFTGCFLIVREVWRRLLGSMRCFASLPHFTTVFSSHYFFSFFPYSIFHFFTCSFFPSFPLSFFHFSRRPVPVPVRLDCCCCCCCCCCYLQVLAYEANIEAAVLAQDAGAMPLPEDYTQFIPKVRWGCSSFAYEGRCLIFTFLSERVTRTMTPYPLRPVSSSSCRTLRLHSVSPPPIVPAVFFPLTIPLSFALALALETTPPWNYLKPVTLSR